MHQYDVVEYKCMLSLLSNNSFRKDEKYCRIWKLSPLEKFSVKSFYMALTGPSLSQALGASMWCGLDPPCAPIEISWMVRCVATLRASP